MEQKKIFPDRTYYDISNQSATRTLYGFSRAGRRAQFMPSEMRPDIQGTDIPGEDDAQQKKNPSHTRMAVSYNNQKRQQDRDIDDSLNLYFNKVNYC